MADFADIGSDYTERWLEAQISEHQYQMGHAVSAFEPGRCRNCEERIDDGRAFCDMECRQDFEDRKRSEKRRGRYVD